MSSQRNSPRSNTALERALDCAGGIVPLARICNVSTSVVGEARSTGHVTPKMALRIQEYLGVPARETAPWVFADRRQ